MTTLSPGQIAALPRWAIIWRLDIPPVAGITHTQEALGCLFVHAETMEAAATTADAIVKEHIGPTARIAEVRERRS
jgi:hypothetical protein